MDLSSVTFRTAASVFIALRSRPVRTGAYSFASALVSLIRQSYHRRRGKADKSGPSHRRVLERERERFVALV